MKARNVMFTGLAVASLWALSASAQPLPPPGMGPHHPPPMMGGPGRLIPVLLEATNLTADQETQAHQILDAGRPAVQQLFAQLKQANDDLATLLLAPDAPSTDAVAAQEATIAQLQQQLAQQETSTVLALRAILTPDQLAAALAAKDQMPHWHGHKHDCPPPGN